MMHPPLTGFVDKKSSIPGFVAYLVIMLWFLLTVMASHSARAAEAPPPAPVILTASDMLPEIEQALSAHGMAPGAEIVLNDPQQAVSISGQTAIGHVSYNAASGRFVIRLQQSQAAITGFARAVKSFPVLTRPLQRGEIVQEADIAFVETANAHAGVFLQDASAIIGKQARRPLRPQSPLRASDIAAPVLVKKGALISLTYVLGGLRLSHQAVALASGGAGDVISVRNVESDRILKAIIQDRNLARVATSRIQQASIEG